ncbi:BnaCnng17390D [Brassica napus]|uniref:BnaCnng17390D protein n=1 Tax=Brassica napus TaxID=3708 RepID=A0A078IK96_BRANA|nr:BnaCnng17390D [Brassica napus]
MLCNIPYVRFKFIFHHLQLRYPPGNYFGENPY